MEMYEIKILMCFFKQILYKKIFFLIIYYIMSIKISNRSI